MIYADNTITKDNVMRLRHRLRGVLMDLSGMDVEVDVPRDDVAVAMNLPLEELDKLYRMMEEAGEVEYVRTEVDRSDRITVAGMEAYFAYAQVYADRHHP